MARFAIANWQFQTLQTSVKCQNLKQVSAQCQNVKKYNNQCQNLVNQDLLSKKKQDLTPTQLHPVATVKHI